MSPEVQSVAWARVPLSVVRVLVAFSSNFYVKKNMFNAPQHLPPKSEGASRSGSSQQRPPLPASPLPAPHRPCPSGAGPG